MVVGVAVGGHGVGEEDNTPCTGADVRYQTTTTTTTSEPHTTTIPPFPPQKKQMAGVVPRPGGGRDAFVGNAALALKRDGMEVVGAVSEVSDLPQDWDVYGRLISYAMT